ncbi:HAD family hydrolase [Candidatus Uhrbacteria bacterium]|jgi:phosphoglycolate phosphatase|nr:HAD family hydrolase [Candidatus Uhrbacteria bacterium]MBT7716749.1 HAD family hydrolase [Candidatus Uhrbacteria bacterium]
MKRLLIFDFDGTIASGTNEKYMDCFDVAIKATNVILDPQIQKERLLEFWGKGAKTQLGNALQDHPEKIDSSVKTFRTCTSGTDFFSDVTILDNVIETLKKLKNSGHTLAIASGSQRNPIDRLLSKYKIDYLFSNIISSNDIDDPKKRKPNPYMLDITMKELGFNKSDTYYIGDASTDIQTAKAAGVNSVAVLTGHMNLATAKQLHPDSIIANISELETTL